MKITYINIENFKAIDSLQFNPRMLNILVGRNNTGKTSILQAIKLSLDEKYFSRLFYLRPSAALKYGENSAQFKLKLIEDKRNEVRVQIVKISILELIPQIGIAVNRIFKLALKRAENSGRRKLKNEERYSRVDEIEKKLKELLNEETMLEMVEKSHLTNLAKESVKIIVDGQTNFVSGRAIGFIASELAFQIAEKLNIKKFLGWKEPRHVHFLFYEVLDYPLEYLTFTPDETESVKNEEENLSSPIFIDDPIEEIAKIISDRKRQEVIAHEIEHIIKEDNLVQGLTRFNFNKMVFEGVEYDVSMDSMGDGFKALVGIMASLYQQPKNTIVLLEEPEVHMHPGYMQELTKNLVILSRSRNIQFFISTHSMDLIQCFLDVDMMSTLESEFVKSQFFMLRMSHPKNVVVSEQIDYTEAERAIKEFEWDLRGI